MIRIDFGDTKKYICEVCKDPGKRFVAELMIGSAAVIFSVGRIGLNVYNYNEELYAVDGQKTFGFASPEACVAHGLPYTKKRNLKEACLATQSTANDKADAAGTRVYYDTLEECEKIFSRCSPNDKLFIDRFPSLGSYGGAYYGGFHPQVVGWQVYRADPGTVVPLYASKKPGIGLTSELEEVPLYQPKRDGKGYIIPEPEGYDSSPLPLQAFGPRPVVAPGLMR